MIAKRDRPQGPVKKILLRVSEHERELVKEAARLSKMSANKWSCDVLLSQARLAVVFSDSPDRK